MLTKLYAKVSGWAHSDEGATAVEYGLMVALIAIAIIIAVTAVGTNLNNLFNNVSAELGLP